MICERGFGGVRFAVLLCSVNGGPGGVCFSALECSVNVDLVVFVLLHYHAL